MPKPRVKRHAVTQPLNQYYRFIPLTKNQTAIVDAHDYEWLTQWNWYAFWNPHPGAFYAARSTTNTNGTRGCVLMHRAVLGCGPKDECDHWNHNTLDNRRNNLRRCNRTQNLANMRKPSTNTTGYKGVCWQADRERWASYISVANRTIPLGRFEHAEDAARAYDNAARKYYGEFAYTNFTA